ncbi:hypothetical protein IU500_27085 [Nocardia terpenica]|uniref:hypothetical protein n=1 Tax=Nocardia terpenica TaxID=455432 RepID=UPI0012FE689C|nr:hypothetical protein [Nocardia terpenica]MBF6064085.1 hypothetical protein [Nocardia terpenica]MBF6107679.1 hypothetical protein [Nocardia terpenica]MBF6114747.1 hypothetical protein [Nocardia terpenica]MBF6121266.1 hypothetical protein [Nocardia terpenica]MBF6153192.1 hypothetical protein [Nocardia terpenica]
MNEERSSEANGLRATWRLDHHNIGIIFVRKISDDSLIVLFPPDDLPDLARAREIVPNLMELWDAVRRDFWTEFIPSLQRPPTGRSRRV